MSNENNVYIITLVYQTRIENGRNMSFIQRETYTGAASNNSQDALRMN